MAIRWQRKDYLQLGKAVSRFNKIKNELEKILPDDLVPESYDYQELKETITTRSELNRVLRSLRAMNVDIGSEVITLPNGEQLTKYQYSELKKQKRLAIRNLESRLEKLQTPKARRKIFKSANGKS